MTIEVYPCGAEVETNIGFKKGSISGIEIRFNNFMYEIKYFHEGEFKTTWLHEGEFTCQTKKVELGFKKIKYDCPGEPNEGCQQGTTAKGYKCMLCNGTGFKKN